VTAPVRLADLPPAGRRIVIALLDAARAADARKAAPAIVTPEAAQPEVHCHARPAA
jgi:hypothetical protein